MADWNEPALGSAYADFHDVLKARDVDAMTLMNTDGTNIPENAIKYLRASDKFQERVAGVWVDKVLSIAGGGTGAATAANARTALGLGTIATQNANGVNITGGTISGINFNANVITAGNLSVDRMPLGGSWPNLTSQLTFANHAVKFAGLGAAYASGGNVTLGDTHFHYECTGGTVTLPSAIGITGRIFVVKRNGTAVTFATTSSQTVDGSAPASLLSLQDLESYWFQSDGANWKIIAKTGSTVIKQIQHKSVTLTNSATNDFNVAIDDVLDINKARIVPTCSPFDTSVSAPSVQYGVILEFTTTTNVRVRRQNGSDTCIGRVITFDVISYRDVEVV